MAIYHVTDQGISMCGGGHKWKRLYRYCPTCRRDQKFVMQVATGYYDPVYQCVECGTSWESGFLLNRYDGDLEKAKHRWETAISPREVSRLEDEEYERIIGEKRPR